MSERQRRRFRERLRLPLQGDESTRFFTRAGTHVATGYLRVVIGDRGPYVEFEERHLLLSAFQVPEAEAYRLWHRGRAYPEVFYVEHRTRDASRVMLYEQLKEVAYADYRVGLYYISPTDLTTESKEALYLEAESLESFDLFDPSGGS